MPTVKTSDALKAKKLLDNAPVPQIGRRLWFDGEFYGGTMFEGKKVLVTGGAGLVGSNLIPRLVSLGADVKATLHEKAPDIFHNEVNYIYGDLTNQFDCGEAVAGMDYVIMSANVLAGAGVMANKEIDLNTPNMLIQTFLLKAAYEAGVKKCLFFGSTTAYAESGDRPIREEDMFIGDPWDKYFSIGWYKRYGEKLCQWYSEIKDPPMPCVVVRPSNIYGPHDKFDWERSHVTASLIRKVIERHNPLEIWGDGSEVRDLIYVDDVVDGILLAMEKLDHYEPVHLASGRAESVMGILQTLLRLEAFYPEVTRNKSKPSMISKRLVDTTKAKNMLGFKAKTSLEDGLRQTIKWYCDTQGGKNCPIGRG